MEEIIKHFREGITEFAVIILGFVIIFTGMRDDKGHTGFLEMMGDGAEFTEFNYSSFADFKGIVEESKKTLPTVTYDLSEPGITAGEEILLTDYIDARDRNAQELDIKVKKILLDENEVTDIYDASAKKVTFPTSGRYVFYIAVTDDTMRVQTKKIEIPVNRSI